MRLAAGGTACARLRFLGAIDKRHRLQPSHLRSVCFDQLRVALHERLVQTYDAWEEEPFFEILRSDHFYLNLHKGCEAGRRSPVTFARAYPLDARRQYRPLGAVPSLHEAEFNGTVRFMPQDAIPAAFNRMCRLEDEWRAEARQAHALFPWNEVMISSKRPASIRCCSASLRMGLIWIHEHVPDPFVNY